MSADLVKKGFEGLGSRNCAKICIGDPALKWFLALSMRRICLLGAFFLLVVGTVLLWQHRFQRSADHPTLELNDFRSHADLPPGVDWLDLEAGRTLRLRSQEGRSVVIRLELPGIGAVDRLLVRYVVATRGLKPGKERWQDGRCIIEWHPPGGGKDWENDPVFTARQDHEGKPVELVMRPLHGPAVPVLRVENLGRAGDLEVRQLEVTVLNERWIWKIGRWLLMAAWMSWIVACIRPTGIRSGSGALAAAVVWLLMGLYFVVPGPWKSYRALGPPFEISGEIVRPIGIPPVVASVGQSVPPAPVATVGEIPQNGDFTLTLKLWVANAKWTLHIALLAAPVFLTALFVGRRQALFFGILFSLAVEGAQIAFGYGTDATDLVDLAADAAGILLALVAHRLWVSWWKARAVAGAA
jgi:hypothetical protein